ncbi:hypothetical protein PsAD2_00267 [Pseudovibrio axinellae]|uniref:Uncharacterized protein n=1 Tax=Pseudovibrio axinellae TaxID=989403 RepID=A0A166B2W4_9HYPH|nr:hypothetical protein PsAD2_00267 [Pseudovibrio axinellae]SEQ80443.1 hypothetical protein SAMN05421798_104261 [Pseudovibrio axinellae]
MSQGRAASFVIERMKWTSKRRVTKQSMMSWISNVSMP